MKRRFVGGCVGLALGALSVLVPLTASATAQPACVVIKQGNLNLQLGYAPNGPRDCTRLP